MNRRDAEREAARKRAERLTEKDGVGLVITRSDGSRWVVRPGGKLERVKEGGEHGQ